MRFHTTVLVICLVFSALASTFGQNGNVRRYHAKAIEKIAFNIKETKTPIFPARMRLEGFTEGHATFSVFVNQFGELEDYLLLEASHMPFAEAVEKVLPKWEYSVPFVDGETAAIVSTVKVKFNNKGAVIYEAVGLYLLNQIRESFMNPLEYRIHTIDELDAIPEPLHIVKPDFHVDLLERRNIIEAVFEFYIDTEGTVRMPTLREADDEVDELLLLIAQESLLQWKFSVPTIKGNPVITKTAQPFRFRRARSASK